MLELYISIIASVIAYVYAGILMEPKHILYEWWEFLSKNLNEGNKPKWKTWLYNLLTCPLCMAGQFALWSFLIVSNNPYYPARFIDPYLISLIFTVSLSILLAKILSRWS